MREHADWKNSGTSLTYPSSGWLEVIDWISTGWIIWSIKVESGSPTDWPRKWKVRAQHFSLGHLVELPTTTISGSLTQD